MLNILSTFTNQDGSAFPNTLAVDSSGALSTDGTEFIAALVNDYCFGVLQAVLAYTGQTPNGTLEGPSNSQFLEGMRRGFSYPGEVFAAAINFDPASIGYRAIKLIGQGIAVASYPLLVAAVYVGDANNAAVAAAGGKFYKATDSAGTTPSTSGAYLILPDMRGLVIRGLDTPAAVDPDGASRYLGHKQLDSFQGHYHQTYWEDNTGGSEYGSSSVNTIYKNQSDSRPTTGRVKGPITGASGTVRFSTETRMINCALDFYIRY